MKNFWKMTLAVICGLLIFGVIAFMLTMGIIGSLASAGSSKPSLPKSGVLKIDMSSISLAEQTQEGSPLAAIQGVSDGTIGIWDATRAINIAAADPSVKFIYLLTDGGESDVAELYEFRQALKDFRELSGKPVVSYIEMPTTGSYYLSSVSDKIYMTSHEGATTMVTGVGTQMFFLGDLLKKLGVNMQLIRHGKYKSAGEMYTRNSSSEENREQYQRMVDSMWETLSAEIAEGRRLTVDQVNDAIDNLKLNLPEDYLECGFVDELLDRQGLEDKLSTLAVEDKFKNVKMIDFCDYVEAKVVPIKSKKKIAVIYADGEIMDAETPGCISGNKFSSIIRKVAADSTVKAVVLRVNSPGGSVLASEKIKTELDALKGVKPLIASYGAYAASGGYWISNNCDRIFANPLVLTGSIGVFGIVPDLSKTASDIAHVGIESVTSNKHGDMYGFMRPFDSEEYNYMLRSIESIYDKFTTVVSEGRGIPKETVDSIGQGRVWTGTDGLSLNLVDEIGTLEDALRYAALQAGDSDIDNWAIKEYPRPQSQMEQILSMMNRNDDGESVLAKAYRQISEPKILARLDTEINVR